MKKKFLSIILIIGFAFNFNNLLFGTQDTVIDHAFGKTTIKTVPKRIVTASSVYLDILLSLGINPVAAGQFDGISDKNGSSWQKGKLNSGKTTIIVFSGVNNIPYEKIANLKPDLILSDLITDENIYKLMSKIAPTVPAINKNDWSDSWQSKTRIIGKIIKNENKTNQLISNTEKIISNFAKSHPNLKNKSFAEVMVTNQDIYVVNSENDEGVKLFKTLGMHMASSLKKLPSGPTGTGKISYENLDQLNPDFLLLTSYLSDVKKVIDNSLFKKTNTFKKNNYYILSEKDSPSVRMPSPLSIPWLLNKIESKLKTI